MKMFAVGARTARPPSSAEAQEASLHLLSRAISGGRYATPRFAGVGGRAVRAPAKKQNNK